MVFRLCANRALPICHTTHNPSQHRMLSGTRPPSIIIFWLIFFLFRSGIAAYAVDNGGSSFEPSSQILTNVGQFYKLSDQDYLRGCPFHLTGTATMVDTNRNLLVLQDATGALAIHLTNGTVYPQPGQLVSLVGENASPYVASFPDYPYWPSGWDMSPSFEAPANWGDYHLTRMRGYLHPPETGEYTFWIASDNSGELWLSPDKDPGKAKRIALLKAGEWVNSREWSRYPWQRSEPVMLQAQGVYYIEAFEEQLTVDDNLAVAWEGPDLKQSVIAGRYLSPYISNESQARFAGTARILREYWTNYTAGNLTTITGPRPFESALAAKNARISVLGEGAWPTPLPIGLDQQLRSEDNYRWIETEGVVTFMGNDGNSEILELVNGQSRVRIRAPNQSLSWPPKVQSQTARVQGVCEGVLNDDGRLVPGFIWVPTESGLSFESSSETNWQSFRNLSSYHFTTPPTSSTNRSWGGFLSFLSVRGVVTFNDQVLGQDYLFIQNDTAGIPISQSDRRWGATLQLGQWVTFGGNLQPTKYSPSLHPLLEWTLGWRPMPEPATDPVTEPVAPSRDGQWTELEGVVRSVNSNGTMELMGKGGAVTIWIGGESTNDLARYVDATVRLRGVLSLAIEDSPMLLVPSRSFVEEEENAKDPFRIPLRSIAGLEVADSSAQWTHRVRIKGMVIYRNERFLLVQDASGGARVQTVNSTSAQVGDWVEVVGFPQKRGPAFSLTDALVHITAPGVPLDPFKVNLNGTVADKYDGMLVQMEAILLAQKTSEGNQLLELQQGQRIFSAVLSSEHARLPSFAAGSLLKITGVCDVGVGFRSSAVKPADESISSPSVQIRVRSASDVVLLRGPPVWTWKEVAIVVSGLLVLLAGALLRIYLLRRRLERQQALQFAFSRQMLHGQESERRRIAANLHDSLGQSLLVIKNQARQAAQSVTDTTALQQRLDKISGITTQAIEEVRQVTHDLRPYQLDRLGLAQAVRAIIQRVSENSPIQFASHVDDIDGCFDQESEIHVYRIVQECLNNVIKHSGAAEATVVVKRHATTVSLSFRDNGRGFDTSAAPEGRYSGFGLTGIAERARILGGNLTVDSRPGEGANLTVTIPIPRSKHEA